MPTKNPLDETKYFIYARKSSESSDRQAASIESQISELQMLARDQKLNIVDVLQESQSAKKPGRPVFIKMLERIHKGEASGIICWKLDRLARNPIDGGTGQLDAPARTFGKNPYLWKSLLTYGQRPNDAGGAGYGKPIHTRPFCKC